MFGPLSQANAARSRIKKALKSFAQAHIVLEDANKELQCAADAHDRKIVKHKDIILTHEVNKGQIFDEIKVNTAIAKKLAEFIQ